MAVAAVHRERRRRQACTSVGAPLPSRRLVPETACCKEAPEHHTRLPGWSAHPLSAAPASGPSPAGRRRECGCRCRPFANIYCRSVGARCDAFAVRKPTSYRARRGSRARSRACLLTEERKNMWPSVRVRLLRADLFAKNMRGTPYGASWAPIPHDFPWLLHVSGTT